MPELFIYKRAAFPPGKQQLFLDTVFEFLNIQEVARLCACSERTVRDWRREKFRMPADVVYELARRAGVQAPKHAVSNAYAHTAEAGRKGYAAVVAAHGQLPRDEEIRKKAWATWWEETGKYQKHTVRTPREICKPEKSAELAEFIGIMMGDGGMSRYQATVTLHHIDDRAYSVFVARRIRRLFGYAPSIRYHKQKSVISIVMSRVELVRYLHGLGLPVGDKIRQGLDIPDWIRSRKDFSISCVRGLIDTDGCIFTHKYTVRGKPYSYKKLSFTSASEPLLRSVGALLTELGMHPRMGSNNNDLRLESAADMERYFSLIGTNNPKHLRRYRS